MDIQQFSLGDLLDDHGHDMVVVGTLRLSDARLSNPWLIVVPPLEVAPYMAAMDRFVVHSGCDYHSSMADLFFDPARLPSDMPRVQGDAIPLARSRRGERLRKIGTMDGMQSVALDPISLGDQLVWGPMGYQIDGAYWAFGADGAHTIMLTMYNNKGLAAGSEFYKVIDQRDLFIGAHRPQLVRCSEGAVSCAMTPEGATS